VQQDLFIDTPLDDWWSLKVSDSSTGDLVRAGDKLARYAMELIKENHELNVDKLK
jgi:hypothetical protein|tara:strand:+ start:645 stop:809 length:165 start_codon:yes stop_codon:yes gene_type:complete